MKIALDIGHANGTGARGNGLEEHAVAAQIGKHLEGMLKERGHAVTVIDFPGLSNAADINATVKAANAGGFDIGISLHCDASDNAGAKGGHVCYVSPGGLKLATSIAGPLASLLPGRAERTVKRTNLAVLNQTRPVWVLSECGFITNAGDAAVMRERPEAIAQAIFEGIQGYKR